MIIVGELINSSRKKIAQALIGKDEYCMNYIKAYRAEKLLP